MKKFYLLLLIILLPILSACAINNQYSADDLSEFITVDEEGNTSFDGNKLNSVLDTYNYDSLSDNEKQGILYMIEEEKLAGDVYAFLYDKWNMSIFNNISASEQTHTEAVQNLANRYSVSIPSSINEAGKYQNSDLQKLYNDLTTQASVSLDEALKVGAAIEEIDILDLTEYISQTDKEDIKLVYENLMKGSRNHLRSFVKNIDNYTSQYLDNTEYNKIINSDIERGGSQKSNGRGGRK